MPVSGKALADHIVMHSVLGVTTGGGGGDPDLNVTGGRLWVYDSTRSKWLSPDRLTATAGRRGRAKQIYLRLISDHASNLTGYRLPRKATLTKISAQTPDNETWTLRVRKNGSSTNLASLAISSSNGQHSSLNVDLDEGDVVQFFADTSTFFGIKDPFVWVEIAWRQ